MQMIYMKSHNHKKNILFYSVLLILICFLPTQKVFAYGHGLSSFPLQDKKTMLTTEMVGDTTGSKGMGIQARVTQRLNSAVLLDGGLGFSDGDRGSRIFVGTDVELYPDYENQPKVSVRGFLENAKEFNSRRNIFGVSPTVSKGFAINEHPIYPFASLPIGLTLDSKTNKYEVKTSIALGASSALPLEGFEHLLLSSELNINLRNSFTGIFFGLSYKLN